MSKVKASWDVKSTKIFIDLCIEQVEKGTRKNTSFEKKGWKEISEAFIARTGRLYDKGQFKNKYDALRKEWQLWDRLLNETGVGWDDHKKTIVADDDWWEKKLLVSDSILGPYRRERYHLPDFRRSSRLENDNERFNYLHSSLRCTIERTFGVWKNKFAILQTMRSYSFPTQVKIVCATMAIHNFIRRTSISDPDFRHHEREDSLFDVDGPDAIDSSTIPSLLASSSDMASLRDSIRDQIIYYTQEH